MPGDITDSSTIITDEEIDTYLGGQVMGDDAGARLMPESWDDLAPARDFGRDECLRQLKKQARPIKAEYIADPSELKTAIMHASSFRLFKLAATRSMVQGGDVFAANAADEWQCFIDELQTLDLSLTVDHLHLDNDEDQRRMRQRGPRMTFKVWRS